MENNSLDFQISRGYFTVRACAEAFLSRSNPSANAELVSSVLHVRSVCDTVLAGTERCSTLRKTQQGNTSSHRTVCLRAFPGCPAPRVCSHTAAPLRTGPLCSAQPQPHTGGTTCPCRGPSFTFQHFHKNAWKESQASRLGFAGDVCVQPILGSPAEVLQPVQLRLRR